MKNRKKRNLWASRFNSAPDMALIDFTESVSYDFRLAEYDIRGSLAHLGMLKRIGLVTAGEAATLSTRLKQIGGEIRKGTFKFDKNDEDVHMNIEKALIRKTGPVGGKIHTARSRNDQVAVDTRMYLKDVIMETGALIKGLVAGLVKLAEMNMDVVIPAYTHLQQAQPISAAHYFLSYAWQFKRDLERFYSAYESTDSMPLGVGACAGVNYPNDRKYLAKELGFSRISENSLDTVSDRDYQAQFLFACALCQTHISRLAEDLIIYNTAEFGYVMIDDAFTTGSSIMPNKKNPDILELLRGKTGRMTGNLTAMLTILKGLPMSYNRDLQEDKVILFDSADNIRKNIKVMTAILPGLKMNKTRIAASLDLNFILATDLADYLVSKKVPFRQAHGIVGAVIKECSRRGKTFQDLTLKEYKAFSKAFDKDVFGVFDYNRSISRKKSAGGTNPADIKANIRRLREGLK